MLQLSTAMHGRHWVLHGRLNVVHLILLRQVKPNRMSA